MTLTNTVTVTLHMKKEITVTHHQYFAHDVAQHPGLWVASRGDGGAGVLQRLHPLTILHGRVEEPAQVVRHLVLPHLNLWVSGKKWILQNF